MRIAVIGAGPSGSRAAAGLAALGHDVTLVDRSFDREKPCGGGVPAAGLSFLLDDRTAAAQAADESSGQPRADARDAGAAGGFRVTALALEGPARARASLSLPGPLAIFSRRKLD